MSPFRKAAIYLAFVGLWGLLVALGLVVMAANDAQFGMLGAVVFLVLTLHVARVTTAALFGVTIRVRNLAVEERPSSEGPNPEPPP